MNVTPPPAGPFTILKEDQFPGMRSHKVPQPIDGAPNFRGLPGMPIFGTGMPTIEGIVAVLRVRGRERGGAGVCVCVCVCVCGREEIGGSAGLQTQWAVPQQTFLRTLLPLLSPPTPPSPKTPTNTSFLPPAPPPLCPPPPMWAPGCVWQHQPQRLQAGARAVDQHARGAGGVHQGPPLRAARGGERSGGAGMCVEGEAGGGRRQVGLGLGLGAGRLCCVGGEAEKLPPPSMFLT